MKNPQDALKYVERFNANYPRFRLFFDNASRIPYVTDLVKVPTLPGVSQYQNNTFCFLLFIFVCLFVY